MKKSVRILSQKGQSSVEYLLIVAVLVLAIFTFGGQLKKGLGEVTEKVFSSIGGAVQNRINDGAKEGL